MIALAGVITSGAVAVLVALIVSGRDDRRQREAERRAVQRETIIALQDGWYAMDGKLTNVRHLIQRHQSIGRDVKARAFAEPDALASFEEEWTRTKADSERLSQSGDEMNDAVLSIRQFEQWIELLESRVSVGEVKDASSVMRVCVEDMILDVANRDGRDYNAIRIDRYEPAYEQFIRAGYEVLADLDRAEERGGRWQRALRWLRLR